MYQEAILRWCMAAMIGSTAFTSAQADLLSDIAKDGKIILGYRESAVPFSYVDQGKPVGYAFDICHRLTKAVQQHLGLPKLDIRTQVVTSDNRVDLVAKKQVHLECGSTANNAARREKVAFAIPHFITGARMAVRANSDIDQLQDAGLKKIASTKGSTQLEALRRLDAQRLLRSQIIEVADNEQGIIMVEKGEVDAFVMGDVLLAGLIARRPNPSALKVTGRFMSTEALAVMLPKGEEAFKKVIDAEMRRLILSREIYQIYADWFEKPIPPQKRSLNLPVNYLLRDFWKQPTDQVPY
jgi:glutamate/aspartate transport system substrate-binding protein